MAKNRQVLIKFEGDSRGLVSASKLSQKELKEIQASAKNASSELKGLTVSKQDLQKAGLVLTAGLAAGAAAIVANTRAGLKQVDAQAKLARSLDTTYDSVTALNMAFGDGGIESWEASLNRLNRRLGAAALGRGSALKAVQELNLDLEKLAEVSADERIALIADQIKAVSNNSQEAARYAQDLGFEQKEAAQFFLQGGDAVRKYADDVQSLGLSLSDFEAAGVERANDAMGVFDDILQSVQQRLAARSAPYLENLLTQIEDNVKEIGGFGTATDQVFESIIDKAVFVVNAFDGIGRAFKLTANAMVATASGSLQVLAGSTASVLEVLDKIPTVRLAVSQESIDSLREFQRIQSQVANQSVEELKNLSQTPLAGDRWFSPMQDRIEENRKRNLGTDSLSEYGADGSGVTGAASNTKDVDKTAEAYRNLTVSLSEQRTMLGMTERDAFIYETQMRLSAEANDEMRGNVASLAGALYDEREALNQSSNEAKRAKEIIAGLRTEEERLHDAMNEVKLLAEGGHLNADEEAAAIRALNAELKVLADRTNDSRDQFEELREAVNGWGRDFANSVVEADFTFESFANNIIKQLAKIALQQPTQPLFNGFGNLLNTTFGGFFSGFGGSPVPVAQSADGNLFTRPSLTAIAERGQAEAVLPLARVGGQLGVQVAGSTPGSMGQSIQISISVDANGSAVAANEPKSNQLGKVLGNAVRDVLIQEKRPGGLLS